MKGKALVAGAVALAMVAMCSGQVAAEYPLLVDVVGSVGYFVGVEPVVVGQIWGSGILCFR